MAKNTENRTLVMQAAGNARMLRTHWDNLPEDERKRMAMELCDGAIQLMKFRAAIMSMIDFESPPHEALREHLGD